MTTLTAKSETAAPAMGGGFSDFMNWKQIDDDSLHEDGGRRN